SEVEVHGNLAPSTAAAVFRGAATGFQCCYELGHRGNATLAGSIRALVTIQPDGSVGDTTLVESTLAQPEVERCFLRELHRLRFAPVSGGPARVALHQRFGPKTTPSAPR
ncbi:MAG: AgmX/PglI C-terminal domain-containing protein, partial [Minicystis sp.]